MRRKLVIGNWKMHGSTASIADLITGIKQGLNDVSSDVAVCPPFVYLSLVKSLLEGTVIGLGSQSVSEYEQGAYTGEVSPVMLKDLGCEYALVGHSERRSLYAESNEIVAKKFIAAKRQGLLPVLCLGESLEQREAGQTLSVVAGQLRAVIDLLEPAEFVGAVLAYEPVWAIGTGKTASPTQAQEVHAYLRQLLSAYSDELAESTAILYGGSVNAANAVDLFAQQDIDGALVGGASLKAADFVEICLAAER